MGVVGLLYIATLALVSKSSFSDSVPYYGIPVGPLYNGVQGLRGDVFVSDTRTIVIPNFEYKGPPGCKL